MHYRRVGVRLPAVVSAFGFGFRPRQFTQRIQHADHVVFAAVDQRADQAVDLHVVIGHGDDADVQRSFHYAFRHVRVADNPVRRGVQQADETVAGSLRQGCFVVINRFREHYQVLLFGLQLVFSSAR